MLAHTLVVIEPPEGRPAEDHEARAGAPQPLQLPDGGLVVVPDSTMTVLRAQFINLAARHRLPAVYPERFYVADGGLMSYGIADLNEPFRQAASYVDRILKGEKTADLPVQGPTKYATILNLKAAQALGVTVPPGLLVAADEVIE